MAFGAVAGSVAVLITCVQHHELIDIGVVRIAGSIKHSSSAQYFWLGLSHTHSTQGALLQCGLVLLSGLLLWAFRTSDSPEY